MNRYLLHFLLLPFDSYSMNNRPPQDIFNSDESELARILIISQKNNQRLQKIQKPATVINIASESGRLLKKIPEFEQKYSSQDKQKKQCDCTWLKKICCMCNCNASIK